MRKRRDVNVSDLSRPETILAKQLKDYIEHKFSDSNSIYRAIVVEVDSKGGQLEKNPANPANSIKARIITNSIDSYIPEENLTVFWPIFSEHFKLPIKTGEQVFVSFEGEDFSHGLWLSRAPSIKSKLNFSDAFTQYEIEDSSPAAVFGVSPSDKSLTHKQLEDKRGSKADEIKETPGLTKEDIPAYNAKPSDCVIHGSNNSMIVFSSETSDKSATLKAVVGRENEDISENDKVLVLLEENGGKAKIIADKIEVISRGKINFSSKNGIETDSDSSATLQKTLLAEDFLREFQTFLSQLITVLSAPVNVSVAVPAGTGTTQPTTTPTVVNFINQATQLISKLNTLLSPKNKNN